MGQRIQLRSTIVCPCCGSGETLTMPQDCCCIRYDCPECGAAITPKHGDCCVFCSYGDVPCPPVQGDRVCCGEGSVDEFRK
ncbi:MAG: GDCCVxC domain-containing (seleno)protein [Methylocystis sp.]